MTVTSEIVSSLVLAGLVELNIHSLIFDSLDITEDLPRYAYRQSEFGK